MKRIVIHEEHCIGCRLCEVHCLVQHSRSRDIIKAFKVERDAGHVARDGGGERARSPSPCSAASARSRSCLEACISGAMHRDESTGAVVCDESTCVGCWMCIMVCPVGSIQQNLHGHAHRQQVRPVLRRRACPPAWPTAPTRR